MNKEYAAYKEGEIYIGDSKAQVVNQLCTWNLDDRKINAHFKGYKPSSYYSYDDTWTDSEMYADAAIFLFDKLKSLGYNLFISY